MTAGDISLTSNTGTGDVIAITDYHLEQLPMR